MCTHFHTVASLVRVYRLEMSYWQGEGKKLLLSLRNLADSDPFLTPVDWKGLGLKDYPSIVKYPMDLTTMATKLSNKEYATVTDFVADFKLIVSNCKTYNAEFSEVYEMASRMDAEFGRLVPNMLNSWKEEARKIVSILKKNKNAVFFLEPVDWKAMGLTDYLKIVKRPMDLGTVEKNAYTSIDEFTSDVLLIWSNCMLYNADGSEVYLMAEAMKAESEKLFRASFGGGPVTAEKDVSSTSKKTTAAKRKSVPSSTTETEFPLDDDRREDVMRLGQRFALLQTDFLASAIKFIHSKCPSAIRAIDAETVDVDMEIIAKDTSCSNSINQLVKVMLYLQNNPE